MTYSIASVDNRNVAVSTNSSSSAVTSFLPERTASNSENYGNSSSMLQMRHDRIHDNRFMTRLCLLTTMVMITIHTGTTLPACNAFVVPCNTPIRRLPHSQQQKQRKNQEQRKLQQFSQPKLPSFPLYVISQPRFDVERIIDISISSVSSSRIAEKDQDGSSGATRFNSALQQQQQTQDNTNGSVDGAVYRNGLMTIGFITLLFASNSPVLHAAYSEMSTASSIPVLLLNAGCTVVAMIVMLIANVFGNAKNNDPISNIDYNQNDFVIESISGIETTPTLAPNTQTSSFLDNGTKDNEFNYNNKWDIAQLQNMLPQLSLPLQGGIELGVWKFIGTLLNIYGLSLTSAGHGAFLIQLTTLFVPVAQGIMGVPIPPRIWAAISLALGGVFLFTSAPAISSEEVSLLSTQAFQGDIACIGAAVLYATYDLRLFKWGKVIEPLQLITTKVITQATLSIMALLLFASTESMDFISSLLADSNTNILNNSDIMFISFVMLWSGIAVNAIAPYLQVGGQQAVGPARAQILYASQPLWAAILSFLFLHETVTPQGMIGGTAFLIAVMLAATAPAPSPDCNNDICET